MSKAAAAIRCFGPINWRSSSGAGHKKSDRDVPSQDSVHTSSGHNASTKGLLSRDGQVVDF